MKQVMWVLVAVAMSMAAGAVPAVAGAKKEEAKEAIATQPVQKQDIVATAIAAGQFKTLAAALGAAGLVETLQGKGPFTVFAPTDEAFAKLPQGSVEELLKPENKAKLTSILTYHVVSGKVMAKEAAGLKSAKSVNGQSLAIAAKDGSVTIEGAKVVKADIDCSNGVIHVIDSVLLPK